ncbi:microtubule-associated protein 1B [Anopheles nili]|uniref:microtubule-associated protein 1B n=1 Tax=Anopheles nili TaxID=185578 RepID=UPI00237ADF82|nr:microtubule-associated protein 1B [Anopheles nili]
MYTQRSESRLCALHNAVELMFQQQRIGFAISQVAIARCCDTLSSATLSECYLAKLNILERNLRTVNISNTWTLPQEGFSVFYRYFRDKISWFEADAVCQFHHANLVTVDNGVQFDATRAFLKELDVTSAVWIGLMRPENSARFTWTSSKALDPSSGYWAEAIPAMEQPLCAVVDPVRDFRWHALRCGGPETAAFLCELPVPAWAVDCTVTSIPSLTVQYMSDSGTVQLSRDCGESGTKHISCQGKQDRDSIIEQLQCSDEEDLASVLATENNNQLLLVPNGEGGSTASSTRRPQPILEHDILTVVSRNDEDSNNKIEVNPNQIEDTVKNVINKFNLQDLMRSEQAALHSEEVDGTDRDVHSPRKSGYGKKYSPLYEKKHHYAKKPANGSDRNESADEEDEEDEPMLGDQPMQDETETQPIDIIQQAVKPTADGDYTDPAIVGSSTKVTNMEGTSGASEVTSSNPVTTPDSRLRRGTDSDADETDGSMRTTEALPGTTLSDVTEMTTTTTVVPTLAPTTLPVTTVTSLPPALLTTRTTAASHVLPTTPKKEVITGDHFIPPMLLVKARFISARPHTEAPPTTMLPTAPSTSVATEACVTDTTPTVLTTSDLTPVGEQQKTSEQTSAPVESLSKEVNVGSSHVELSSASPMSTAATGTHMPPELLAVQTQHQETSQHVTSSNDVKTSHSASDSGTKPTVVAASNEHEEINALPQSAALVSSIQLTLHSDSVTTTVAPEQVTTAIETSVAPKMTSDSDTTTGTEELEGSTTAVSTDELSGSSESSTAASLSTTMQASTVTPQHELETTFSTGVPKTTQGEIDQHPLASMSPLTSLTSSLNDIPSELPQNEPISTGEHLSEQDHAANHSGEELYDDEQLHAELHNSFSNVENYQPYKPNRHRALTKPEVHNNHGAYIKKILG